MAPPMVSASAGAMNSVLSKLATLVVEDKLGKRSIQKKAQRLRDELMTMKGLIDKLAGTDDLDALVKAWMRQVREMTYDLEDAIDLFVPTVAQPAPGHRSGRLFDSFGKIRILRHRREFEKLLEEINLRIRDASERRSRYGLIEAAGSGPRAVSTVVDDPLPPVIGVDKDSLVGMDRQTEMLMAHLADGQQQNKVLSIVGLGGTGKTTLAMQVYERLKLQFDCRAFVVASRSNDVKEILRAMLSQIEMNVDTEGYDLRPLVDQLTRFLSAKRYFIVIDDIWDTRTWSIIKLCLPENGYGNRILVTTRNLDLAKFCCSVSGLIYYMEPLPDDEAQTLFFRRLFPSEPQKGCDPELNEISMHILKKCGGLPLAITTMASLLASRPYSAQEWKKIGNSVGSSHYNDINGIMDVLNLSYIDLPSHLKTCLLYLSMFPEDSVIKRKRLVRRWIAEGFISADRMEDLEEVGENYFNELLNRSLIQSVGIRYNTRADACRVHDIILDLILSKSFDDNFVIKYDNGVKISGLQDKVRRLFLDCRERWDAFGPSEITTFHVRSLTVIGSDEHMPTLANFRALRVLDVEHYGELASHYFKSIGTLYLLKYLRLRITSVIELPDQIGELQYLETLDLSDSPIRKLPKSIVRLKQLICLLVRNVRLPDGFGNMQNLRELSCIEIDSTNALQELENLSLLKILGLIVCVDILGSPLSKLSISNLQSLYIESASHCSLDFLLDIWSVPPYGLKEFQMLSNYFFPTVPKWVSSLVNLTLLGINIERVGEDVLQTLAELPALLSLTLKMKSTTFEQGIFIRSSGFKSLKQFDFMCQSSWTILMFEPGAMKALEKLQFVLRAHEDCVASGFQLIIKHLTSLKHLVAEIDCEGARAEDVSSAEDAINNAVSIHPKSPRLEIERLNEEGIIGDEREISVHSGEEECRDKGDDGVEHEVVVEEESTPITEG